MRYKPHKKKEDIYLFILRCKEKLVHIYHKSYHEKFNNDCIIIIIFMGNYELI